MPQETGTQTNGINSNVTESSHTTGPEPLDALVVGGGPAGLMAAEALAAAGRRVVVADHKPSVARKFLMAGKSGLNLTSAVSVEECIGTYGDAADRLRPMIEALPPEAITAWARGLGEAVFTGSSGRVFPQAMKASPLLRAWLARLDAGGVAIRTRWRWTGWGAGGALDFATPDGPRRVRPAVTVFALGGASWRRLGSDGSWRSVFEAGGVPVTSFAPANAGLEVAWSDHMTAHLGAPLKNVVFRANGSESRGEAVLSRRGLEGGGLYPLTPELRRGAALSVDLCPDIGPDILRARLWRASTKDSASNRLRKAARLDPAAIALVMETGRPLPRDPAALADLLKTLPLPYAGLRPLDEAISTAGGVSWDAVDHRLALFSRPDTFVAGEMLDWEAPTGGYLLTACLATGLWAGRAAAQTDA
jgi:uncharacterized flavoprotein (TIGR03862 family)